LVVLRLNKRIYSVYGYASTAVLLNTAGKKPSIESAITAFQNQNDAFQN
jgi:hypothetical protein